MLKFHKYDFARDVNSESSPIEHTSRVTVSFLRQGPDFREGRVTRVSANKRVFRPETR